MNEKKSPLLFVALDDLTQKEADTLAVLRKFTNVEGNWGIKVNLDWMLKRGIETALSILEDLNLERPIFVDLKMWNGKRTMRDVFKMLAGRVDYVNSYVLAGPELQGSLEPLQGTKTKVLGVTVLTHYDDNYCQEWFRRSLRDMVCFSAEKAVTIGCDGIILPGTMAGYVSDMKIEKHVPGIRPSWFKDDRHSEEVTPQKMAEVGVDGAVCGSPIIKVAKNPAAVAEVGDSVGALRRILQDLQ